MSLYYKQDGLKAVIKLKKIISVKCESEYQFHTIVFIMDNASNSEVTWCYRDSNYRDREYLKIIKELKKLN
jgi:hypothetical protein